MELLWAYVSCVLYKTQREIRDTDVPIQLLCTRSIIYSTLGTHTHIYIPCTYYLKFIIFILFFYRRYLPFAPAFYLYQPLVIKVNTFNWDYSYNIMLLLLYYLLGIPIDICIVLFFYFFFVNLFTLHI